MRELRRYFDLLHFPRRFLDRLHGIGGVAAVSSVAIENARWVNPETHQEHPIRVFGLDLEFDVIALPGIDPGEPKLKMKDTIIFDASSRPKFGPVAQRGSKVARALRRRSMEGESMFAA